MALSSAFHERLEQMDRTRIQRLSLLQAEKELQVHKSRILATKLAYIRAMEQRIFLLDRNIASQNFKLLSLKSQIENLESKYDSLSQELRLLQNEVEELEEMHKMKDSFYDAKISEMNEFKEKAEKFVVKCEMEVESLRNQVNEKIPHSFTKIHGDHVQNPLFLKPPDGKEWEIHWNKHEGDILFQKGWKEFSKYYSLAHAYMVLFEYDDKKETCHFLVHIFNKNKVEIKYSFHPTQDEQQHGLNQIPVEQLPCKKRRPNHGLNQIPVEQLPCKKRRPKSPKSHPQPPKKLRTNPTVDVGRSSKLQNLPKYVQVKEEIDDTTECLKVDQEKEQLTDRNFKSKTPSFEVVMKSTYVEQHLYVPSEFAVKYFNTEATDILLKVKDERTWLVRYNFNKFSVGWKTFASDNNLKVGDSCLFVLTKSQPLTFKVLIFHHWKEPQESSAQPDELDDHARIPNAEIKTSISMRGKTSPCTFTNNDALEKAEKFTSTLENPHYILNLKTSNWEFYRPHQASLQLFI